MLENLLNRVNVLEKGLDASYLKNDVIAGNIANVDTPDYKSSTVSFESMFQDALSSSTSAFSGASGSASASENSIYQAFLDSASAGESGSSAAAGSKSTNLDALDAQVVQNSDTSLRMDGNNVDVDYEMTELAKNSILYDTLTYAAAKEINRLKYIISEGK